jgi:hypothetical protein
MSEQRQEEDPTAVTRASLLAMVPGELIALATRRVEGDLSEETRIWTGTELQREFKVIGFMAPFVVVERRADGVKGSLMFTHSPRYYFGWEEDRP